ncbi:MAG: hypothetical protein K2P78_07930 [Gemmataceae bacterium]|nr:hypothetical protein [Gemmataceae bacterium]
MEADGGEPPERFRALLSRARAGAVGVAANLTEGRRQQYLEAVDRPERRMELFERWPGTADGAAVRNEGLPPDPRPRRQVE